MKKRYFIPLLTLSFIVGAILTQKTALAISASDLIQIQYDSNFVCVGPGSGFVQQLGSDIHGGASSVFLRGYDQYNVDPYFYLMSKSSGDFNDPAGWVQEISKRILNWPNNTSSTVIEVVFDSYYTFNPDLYYYIWISDSQRPGWSWSAKYNNPWPYGFPFGWTAYLQYPVYDMYFQFAGNIENLINITFPKNATTTPDFSTWHAEFMVGNTPPVFGKIKINYGLSTSTLNLSDEINFIAYDNNLAPVAIPKDTLLQAGKQYFANAEIIIGTSTIATSSIISFNISGGGGYLENFHYAIPISTISTTTPPIQITCDPNDNLFQYSLCKLALWLFIPDAGTLNKFSTLTDDIKNKPPIGYFYAVKTAFNGLSSTSTKAFQLANVTPLNNSVFNPLKTGISFILWLGCGIWIFNRIRHIQL